MNYYNRIPYGGKIGHNMFLIYKIIDAVQTNKYETEHCNGDYTLTIHIQFVLIYPVTDEKFMFTWAIIWCFDINIDVKSYVIDSL